MANGGDQPVDVLDVSCGSSHSVALLSCDAIATWGRGEDGQLGHGTPHEVTSPKVVHALLDAGIDFIRCGAEYTVAVSTSRGHAYSWGWGDFGRLGHGDSTDVFLPRQIAFFEGRKVVRVACGDTHTLAVTDDGGLYTFGRNQNGQLGLGHTNDGLSPQLVTALQGQRIASVACGSEHSLAATEQGRAYAWGWGRYGNLGDGEAVDRYLPTAVVGLEGSHVSQAECGWRHSAVVTDAGRVYTFGWSKYGQLGHGDHTDHMRPKLVESLLSKLIIRVAGGWRHTMAADQEGRLYAWGWNKFGQLGLGDTEDRSAPTPVAALAGKAVSRLACGWRHTLCVTSAGEVYSWGRGVNGQLGQGEEADLYGPTLVQALSRGYAKRDALLATAADPDSYAVAADRYAVVPGADDAAVPSVPMVPEAPDAGDGGGGQPANKKLRTSLDVPVAANSGA